MVRHIDSLVLVWRIAEIEARHLGSRQIEPSHLFLGLLKIVDLNLEKALVQATSIDTAAVNTEVEFLRRSFGEYDLDTTRIRRRFRRYLKKGEPIEPNVHLRRSPKARETFARAEALAEPLGGNVHPLHLAVALLQQQDASSESILEEAGCFPTELRRYFEAQLAKLQIS
jgi:ATP-dependent Clp protease ATP-binding subunit ClpC